MMRPKFYSATTGFLFLFLFLCRTDEVRAEGRNIAAEMLCEHAQTFYERGEKKEALQEFSKVLLVDPDNPTAHEYLAKLGVPQGLYRPLKTVTVHRRGGEGDGSSAADQRLSKLDHAILRKDRDLSDYQKMLVMKDKEIFNLKDTLSRTLQLKQDAMEERNKKDETLEEKASQDQDDLKPLIKARDEDIARLKEELALVKKNILSLQKNASVKTSFAVASVAGDDLSSELYDLNSQIRSVQLELTETQMSLKEKDKTLTELKKQLDETTQRNDLSQKIIQEKDSQIKKLQNPQKILP